MVAPGLWLLRWGVWPLLSAHVAPGLFVSGGTRSCSQSGFGWSQPHRGEEGHPWWGGGLPWRTRQCGQKSLVLDMTNGTRKEGGPTRPSGADSVQPGPLPPALRTVAWLSSGALSPHTRAHGTCPGQNATAGSMAPSPAAHTHPVVAGRLHVTLGAQGLGKARSAPQSSLSVASLSWGIVGTQPRATL